MPELPEVETIVRALRRAPGDEHIAGNRPGPSLLGRRISAAELLWEGTLAWPDAQTFTRRLPGQTVQDIYRRGKLAVLQLDQDALLAHLRMSGDLRVEEGSSSPRLPHDRAVIHFGENLRLVFNDIRKFGRLWLTPDPQTVLGGLGPEPLDENLTPEVFYQRLHARRRQLKPLLLDQTFLAGMGNIYTDEALHRARLHPLTPSDRVSFEQASRLLEAIRHVLRAGIRANGASIDWVYRGGSFQLMMAVYGRAGKPCPVCGQPVQRIVIGQRGTHFCPVCQPFVDTPEEHNGQY